MVFDAECVLCSANAELILRNDRQRHFRLASMQSEAGAKLLETNGVDPANPDTIIVVTDGKVMRDSDAVLFIYRNLAWPWPLLRWLAIVPRGIRDAAYRWIARHRYRLFGKRAQCWLPSPADRDRLL